MPSRPKLITPDEHGVGIYNQLTVRRDAGALIIGEYDFLNLAGAHVYKGPLVAKRGSKAKLALFSGAYVPEGIDLAYMDTGYLHAQGVYTGKLTLPRATNKTDLTSSKIGKLRIPGFRMSDFRLTAAYIDCLDFGFNPNRKLDYFEIDEDCTIIEVKGPYPEVRDLRLGENINVPPEFRAYLDNVDEYLRSRQG